MKNRIDYVDVAKAIAIFTVVLGHVNPSAAPGREWLYIDVCYAFHMPLFFIMGGFFLKPKDRYSSSGWGKFLMKNILALMVPYALWAVIYMPFSYTNIFKVAYGSWPILFSVGTQTALWFLPVMCLARIVCEGVFNLSRAMRLDPRIAGGVAIPILFAAGFLLPHHTGAGEIGNLWGYDIALVAAAFLLTGFLIRPFCDRLATARPLWALLVLSIALGLFVLGFRAERPLLEFGHHAIQMCTAGYGPWTWFLANALTGSVVVLALGVLLGRVSFLRQPLAAVGASTMGIYLLHKNVFPELKSLTGFTGDTLGEAMVLATLALALSLLILHLIVKTAPVLIGKTAGSAAAKAAADVFSATLCRDVLEDGKVDFEETTRLLRSVETLAETKGGCYAELRDALVRARADGVITPEESDELCALLRRMKKA